MSCHAQYLLSKVSFLSELRLAEKEVREMVSMNEWVGERVATVSLEPKWLEMPVRPKEHQQNRQRPRNAE